MRMTELSPTCAWRCRCSTSELCLASSSNLPASTGHMQSLSSGSLARSSLHLTLLHPLVLTHHLQETAAPNETRRLNQRFLCRPEVDVSVTLTNHDLKGLYLISFISIKSLLVLVVILCRYFHNLIMADACKYKQN